MSSQPSPAFLEWYGIEEPRFSCWICQELLRGPRMAKGVVDRWGSQPWTSRQDPFPYRGQQSFVHLQPYT